MTFDFAGYALKFIQRDRCNDGSAHKLTYIYKFFSPCTRYHYIVRAEYHENDVYAIKFYCKKDRKSLYKYSRIVNRGDVGNIMVTCAKVIPLLLRETPEASFSFAAARSIDPKSGTIENIENTQRFKIYSYLIPLKIGTQTFDHVLYEKVSSYLLWNKESGASLKEIEDMFVTTYQNLYEWHI